jgi:serine protease inhibitor
MYRTALTAACCCLLLVLTANCVRSKPRTLVARPAGPVSQTNNTQYQVDPLGPAATAQSSNSSGAPNSGPSEPPNSVPVTPGITKLGFDLLARLARSDADKNVFISPASIALALAMTWNGAAGSTNRAMAKVLGLTDTTQAAVNASYRRLLSALPGSDTALQLDIANSLWLHKGYPFNPDFLQADRQTFAAEIDNLDFNQDAVVRINDWVNQKTRGKITRIIEQINPIYDIMFLVNAVYFKGSWSRAFDSAVPGPFTLAGGETRQVPMMSQSGRYLHLRGPGFEAAALPYGSGQAAMYVFLPDPGVSIDSLVRELRSRNWDSWRKEFSNEKGSVRLPRFKFEYETELKEALSALGMAEAFGGHADFSRMTSMPKAYISEVIHKTYVEVNEKGTEAAAVTSVRVSFGAIQPREPEFSLVVDRPFLVMVYNSAADAALFVGAVRNPGEK